MRALHIPRYTVSDYNLWDGDWELIDGIPYAMSPTPVRRHQEISAAISRQIGNAIADNKTACKDCTVVYELDWRVGNDTVLRPDIAVICEEYEDFIHHPPVLIIEILSPATAHKDKSTKYEIYQERGVKYYIIIDPASKTSHINILTGHQYEELETTDFTIHDHCTITLDIAQILAEI
jgi:Uma2 family endonuclease